MLAQPTSHKVCPDTGTLGESTRTYKKHLRDLTGLYADKDAFDARVEAEGDRVVYQVQDRHPDQAVGDLIFGITRMEPGRIGDEFFLTRGHIHSTANRPEIYYGESGEGLMLMESPEGEVSIVEISPRVICYVPPYWIHRSVNTGSTPFVMTFIYPSDSGQDYGVIADTNGMKSRIVAREGGWAEVPNTFYKPRSQAQIDAIYKTGDAA